MKINVKLQPPKFPAPDKRQVLAIRDKHTKRDVLVYYVQTPRDSCFLFTGDGSSTYLPKEDYESFMNGADCTHNYEPIGLYSLNNMEVSFNA